MAAFLERLSFVFDWFSSALMVLFGIGFVIFIHELGHFLAAKWAGVKVEKFALGFFNVLVSYRKGLGIRFGSSAQAYEEMLKGEREGTPPKDMGSIGETEYSLRLLPLGGFVKMLGEDPGDESTKSSDPRAYGNKPVGARMVIISAGVIMNLLFGILCNAWAHLRGMEEAPAILGMVVAGQPAYAAGLRPGDEIIKLDGRTDITFRDLSLAASLSGAGQALKMDVRRPGVAEPIHFEIEPRREPGDSNPRIGVFFAFGLALANPPFTPPSGLESTRPPELHPGDVVKSVGLTQSELQPVSNGRDLDRWLANHRDQPIAVELAREYNSKGRRLRAAETARVTIPPAPFVDFGFRLTVGPVAAVRKGSPADLAGFQVGDQIAKVNGAPDFDPMRLPDLAFQSAGKSMSFEVRRGDSAKPTIETLEAMPDDTPPWIEPFSEKEPLDVPGLGFAVRIEPTIVAVAQGSPAARAGLQAGDRLRSVTLPAAARANAPKPKPIPLVGDNAEAWPALFVRLQSVPRGKTAFQVESRSTAVELTPEPVADWYNPMRGLQFMILTRDVPPRGVAESFRLGCRDTWEVVTSIPALIRGMVQQRLGKDQIGGPVEIFRQSFKAAQAGWAPLIGLLGLLSINLAVFNFFPIPPLDGGQMLFLLVEKIRGRPLSDNWIWIPTMVGLVLIVALFVFVFFNDIVKLITSP